MIKPYNNIIYESSNLTRCAKKFYSKIKTENLDANGLFVLKDIDNNKLYKFEINKNNMNVQTGGENIINKLNNDNLAMRIHNLENKIDNLEKILLGKK